MPEVKDPELLRMLNGGGQSGGNILTLPPDPLAVNRDRRAEEDAARRARAEQERARIERLKVLADLEKRGLTLNGDSIVPIPGWQPQLDAATSPKITAKVREDAIQAYSDAEALERIASDLELQFNATIGKTKGVAGLQDYLPTGENQRFDDTSFQARGYVKRGLGFTGGEGNTIGEIGLNYGPYLPEASDRDARIPGKIEALRNLAADSRKKSIAVLGGVPDINGRVSPLAQGGGDLAMELADGPTGIRPDNLAFTNQLNALYRSGASPEELAEFSARNGRPPSPQHMQGIREMVEHRDSGKGFGRFTPQEEDRSALEQGAGAALNNPLGAGIAGATNMLGGGTLEGFAPEQYQMLRDQGGMTGAGLAIGEIVGAVGATSALGKIGGSIASRISPRLLQGGRGAQFGRNLASDATLGAAYGANTAGDPLTGAGLATLGSAGGQVVGKGIGAGIGGLARQADASFLNSRGVPTTVGQDLGGFAKSLEDATTSIPGVGDLVNARHLEGMRGFNQLPFNQVGAQLGVTPTAIGREGLDQLKAGVNPTYSAATAGAQVGFDPQFAAEYAAAQAAGASLPDDFSGKFGKAMQNRVDPVLASGQMTGEQYQQAIRGLKGYRAETTKPGFEQDYRDALTQAMDALKGNMTRQGGDGVVTGLANADQAYREFKTLKDAIEHSGGGTVAGDVGLVAPSQLGRAAQKTADKFGGQRPFGDIIDAGQRVLPSKVPDSGTAKRLMTATLAGGAGLAGAGAGVGAVGPGDPGSNALGGIGIAAMLALASTRTGQNALKKALIDRPGPIKAAGAKVRKRAGLFGSASVPFFLEGSQ